MESIKVKFFVILGCSLSSCQKYRKNFFSKFFYFFLKTCFLGVKSCGESNAHIPEAKKRFPKRLRRDAKIENLDFKTELAENRSPGVFAYGEHVGDIRFMHNHAG